MALTALCLCLTLRAALASPPLVLHFLVASRNGSAPVVGAVRVNWSLPVLFWDPDGVARDPQGFVGEIAADFAEVRYLSRFSSYFSELRRVRGDLGSELLIEAVCGFVPERLQRCQLFHRVGARVVASVAVRFDGSEPFVTIEDPEWGAAFESQVARGLSLAGPRTDALRDDAGAVYARWRGVYARILNAASIHSAHFIFEYDPESPRDVFCHLRSPAPLPFSLVLEGPGLEPIVAEAVAEKECTTVTIGNVVVPDSYDLDRLVCTFVSPLGRNVSVRGPVRAIPRWAPGDGIAKEYVPGVRYFYRGDRGWTVFATVAIVCVAAVLAFWKALASVLVVLGCVIDPPEESGPCEACARRKKSV